MNRRSPRRSGLRRGAAMRSGRVGGEIAALERLRSEESAFERQLDEARREAAEVAAEAARQVAVIREDAARRLAAEVAELERTSAAEREALAASAHLETARAVEAARARAAAAREEAVATVLDAIGAGAT